MATCDPISMYIKRVLQLGDKVERIFESFDRSDAERQVLLVLIARCLDRRDSSLSKELEAYASEQSRDAGELCNVDLVLNEKIKSVCNAEETRLWERALAYCILRGDGRKADALQDLMRQRVLD